MGSIYFLLFSNCIPVKGATRSVICDLGKNKLILIPNDLYEILIKYNGSQIEFVKSEYNNRYDDTIDEYFQYLNDNDLIFFTESPENFPKIKTTWYSPRLITNAIIDFVKFPNYEIKSVLKQLNILQCKHLQLRFFNYVNWDYIDEICSYVKNSKSSIISIDIIKPYSKNYSVHKIEQTTKKYPRINSIILSNSSKEEILNFFNPDSILIQRKENIGSHLCCGQIGVDLFSINIKTFTESLKFNSCLNKKISIDANGLIKNCPSMKKNFGNIKKTKLIDIVLDKEFQSIWSINKNQISSCSICEFRYVCTDCRAFLEEPENIYSKPLKCGYNPFTNEWSDWSTNPLKKVQIEHYGLQS